MIAADTCLGFHTACDTMILGIGVTIMGFVIFVGSVLLLISAVFGRRMGFLVLSVSFFGWMIFLSSLWLFGFYSQGPETPVNLGPRGQEPAWVVEAAGTSLADVAYGDVYATYPSGPAWRDPRPSDAASVQSVTGAAQSYMATQANAAAGIEDPFSSEAFQTTDFSVSNLKFATDGDVSLAGAQAYYNGGGPLVNVYLRHDSGSVPVYGWIFLGASVIAFLGLLPLLDRTERKRKEILTGGTAPPWYGPA